MTEKRVACTNTQSSLCERARKAGRRVIPTLSIMSASVVISFAHAQLSPRSPLRPALSSFLGCRVRNSAALSLPSSELASRRDSFREMHTLLDEGLQTAEGSERTLPARKASSHPRTRAAERASRDRDIGVSRALLWFVIDFWQ